MFSSDLASWCSRSILMTIFLHATQTIQNNFSLSTFPLLPLNFPVTKMLSNNPLLIIWPQNSVCFLLIVVLSSLVLFQAIISHLMAVKNTTIVSGKSHDSDTQIPYHMKCEVVAIVCLDDRTPIEEVIIVNDPAGKITLAQNRNMLLIVVVSKLERDKKKFRHSIFNVIDEINKSIHFILQ